MVPKGFQALGTVFGVTLQELEAGFRARQWRGADVDAEHVAKPVVLAHALVNHLLVHAASAVIVLSGPQGQIAVQKFTPDAEDLYSLGRVAVDQEVVSHDALLFRRHL